MAEFRSPLDTFSIPPSKFEGNSPKNWGSSPKNWCFAQSQGIYIDLGFAPKNWETLPELKKNTSAKASSRFAILNTLKSSHSVNNKKHRESTVNENDY